MATETLHMRVGPLLGEHLLEIAQTNISNGNIKKGFDTYIKSLCGFTEEYALMCLKNEAVLVTDEDGVSVNLTDKKEILEANAHNILDWEHIIKSYKDDIKICIDYYFECKKHFDSAYHGNIENYSLNDMMLRHFDEEQLSNVGVHNLAAKLIAGDDFAWGLASNGSSVWSHLCSNVEADYSANYERALYWTVEYVNNIRTLHKLYMKFIPLYEFLIKYEFIKPINKIENFIETVLTLLVHFTDQNTGYYHPTCDEKLSAYKEQLDNDILSTEYGKEIRRNGLIKKNILDGYDAGWLSPEGEFYGDDGETSSMLHMNLAELIFNGNSKYANQMNKDGVSTLSGTNSPEQWLTSHGWIKIHHDDCYGSFIGIKNEAPTKDYPYPYCPTEIQIKMICNYIDKFYGGKFYTEANALGRVRHVDPFTTYKVRQMDEFKLHEIFGF